MPRVKAFKEEDIIEKAMELFWEKGFHATSIQDLVNHLGINRASIYDTFGNKRQLFDQSLQHYRQKNWQGLRIFMETQPSIKIGLLAMFEMAITEAENDPKRKGCFMVNATTELAAQDATLQKFLCHNQAEFEAFLAQYLQKGVENGEISANKNLQAIAGMLFGLYNGIRVLSKVNPNREHLLGVIKTGLSVLD